MARTESVLRELGVKPVDNGDATIRAMLLLYLADWKAALDAGYPISDADWRKAGLTPFSDRVIQAWSRLRNEAAHHGISGNYEKSSLDQLSAPQRDVLKGVLQKWKTRPTTELVRIAASTFPMIVDSPHDRLDLHWLARRYENEFGRSKDKKEVA
jgi:hypothetical protein